MSIVLNSYIDAPYGNEKLKMSEVFMSELNIEYLNGLYLCSFNTHFAVFY